MPRAQEVGDGTRLAGLRGEGDEEADGGCSAIVVVVVVVVVARPSRVVLVAVNRIVERVPRKFGQCVAIGQRTWSEV